MSILAVLEQSRGVWNRMSLETLAAAQELGAALGRPVSVAIPGAGIGALAQEAATKKLEKVYAVEHELLASYSADGYTAALASWSPGCNRRSFYFPTRIRFVTMRRNWLRAWAACWSAMWSS